VCVCGVHNVGMLASRLLSVMERTRAREESVLSLLLLLKQSRSYMHDLVYTDTTSIIVVILAKYHVTLDPIGLHSYQTAH
jgi:hypothetical protein